MSVDRDKQLEVTGQVMLQSIPSSFLSSDHLYLLHVELSAVSLSSSSRDWGRHSSIKSEGCIEADVSQKRLMCQ